MWPVGLEGRDGAEQKAWGGRFPWASVVSLVTEGLGAGAPERGGHGRWDGSCPTLGSPTL